MSVINDIKELTLDQVKQVVSTYGHLFAQAAAPSCASQPACRPAGSTLLKVGQAYLIRTVTLHYTGRITAISESEVELEDAAWIADTGVFSTCLKTGELGEVEPFVGKVLVSRAAMVDATCWPHALPRTQK